MDATQRTETSGEYNNTDGYWIWIEGITNVNSITIPIPEPISVIGYLFLVLIFSQNGK